MEDKLMFGTDPEAFSGCGTKAKEDNEVTLTEDDIDDRMVKIDLSNLAKYSHDHLKAWLKYRGDTLKNTSTAKECRHKYVSQLLQNYGPFRKMNAR